MEYCPTDYTNLCAITTYYKSNKGKDANNYSPLYNNILDSYRQHEIRVLEFDTSVESENVKPGGSLQTWSLFLEKATVIGLYQDEKAKYEDEKVKSFVCESITEEDIIKLWETPELEADFDIIIVVVLRILKIRQFSLREHCQSLISKDFILWKI